MTPAISTRSLSSVTSRGGSTTAVGGAVGTGVPGGGTTAVGPARGFSADGAAGRFAEEGSSIFDSTVAAIEDPRTEECEAVTEDKCRDSTPSLQQIPPRQRS